MEDHYRNHEKQSDVDDPCFEHAGRVHDWRNYIGERTKSFWSTFTPEQRMALAADAAESASNEDWE